MLITEVRTADIPAIYERFAAWIGAPAWERQAARVKKQIKGNRFLREYLLYENRIALQLDRLRLKAERPGGVASSDVNDRGIYEAAGFAAQALSIVDTSSASIATQLRGRIRGAMKNAADMRALRLELSAATHFVRRGQPIEWPEMTGLGTFDLYLEGLGAAGLELECKSISGDKGRKVHTREALDFYGELWPHLSAPRKRLDCGLFAVITLPDRLPPSYKERCAVAKEVGHQILQRRSAMLSDGLEIRIGEFDVARLPTPPASAPVMQNLRAVIDDVTSTTNRQCMLVGTEAGGALALAIESRLDDSLLEAVFDTLSDSARWQFSGERGGIFFVGLDALDGDQLLAVAGQDRDITQPPTALRLAVSQFLSSGDRDHVVGVAFASATGFSTSAPAIVESGGIAYYFPKRESPYWSDDFSGLFTAQN